MAEGISIEELQEDEHEFDEVDLEMINRIDGSDDGYLVGEITDVSLSSNSIELFVSTAVGEKRDIFSIPDVPSDEDDIVRLCKRNNISPKYPSLLVGCTVKIDKNDEIVIPKSPKEKITSSFERVFADIDNYYYTKMIFFSMFLPITLTTYYMVLARNERHFMRDNFGDFAIHMLVWIAAASFAGSILVSFLTATL